MIGFLKNCPMRTSMRTHKVRKSEKNAFLVMLASHHSIKKNRTYRKQAKISTTFLNFCSMMTRQLTADIYFEASRALYGSLLAPLPGSVRPFARFDFIYRTQVRTQGTAGSELQLHNQRS